MANFPGSPNQLPGLYGWPDTFRIETHEKGFRLFRVSGMFERPAEVIGPIRHFAKHIFMQIIEYKSPHNEYHCIPFIVHVKPEISISIVSDTQLSGDLVLKDFLSSLSRELDSLMNLMPFI